MYIKKWRWDNDELIAARVQGLCSENDGGGDGGDVGPGTGKNEGNPGGKGARGDSSKDGSSASGKGNEGGNPADADNPGVSTGISGSSGQTGPGGFDSAFDGPSAGAAASAAAADAAMAEAQSKQEARGRAMEAAANSGDLGNYGDPGPSDSGGDDGGAWGVNPQDDSTPKGLVDPNYDQESEYDGGLPTPDPDMTNYDDDLGYAVQDDYNASVPEMFNTEDQATRNLLGKINAMLNNEHIGRQGVRSALAKAGVPNSQIDAVINGLLGSNNAMANVAANVIGALAPAGLSGLIDAANKARNKEAIGILDKGIGLSDKATQDRFDAINAIMGNEAALSALDQAQEDAKNGGNFLDEGGYGGSTAARTAIVAAQMADFPANWFPPGTEYDAELFLNADGSPKTDSQVQSTLSKMWSDYSKGRGNVTQGGDKIFGTNISQSALGGDKVSGMLRNLYEGGNYETYQNIVQGIGGETSLVAPWEQRAGDSRKFLPGADWEAKDLAEQYVDVNPGLARAWEIISAYQNGEDMSKFDNAMGLSPAQQAQYWQRNAGDNNLTKEEFGQAHLAYTGSKANPIQSGEDSISRGRRIFSYEGIPQEEGDGGADGREIIEESRIVDPIMDTTTPDTGDADNQNPANNPIPGTAVTASENPGGDVSPEEGALAQDYEDALANIVNPQSSGVNYLIPVRNRWTGLMELVPAPQAGYTTTYAGGVQTGIPGVTTVPGLGSGRGRTNLTGTPGRRSGWGSTISV
jgi:hypothetical protein